MATWQTKAFAWLPIDLNFFHVDFLYLQKLAERQYFEAILTDYVPKTNKIILEYLKFSKKLIFS